MNIPGAQAAYRVLDVLIELGYRPTGMSLSEIATAVHLTPGTARRLLLVLCDRGFVVQDETTRRYLLGNRVRQLQTATLDRAALREIARPALESLRDETTETVFFSVRDQDEVTYLDWLSGAHMVQMYGRPGMRAPVHATAQGRAIAAHLPEPELDRLLAGLVLKPFTTNTITTVDDLRGDLRWVRACGYAANIEQLEQGVISIASAVLDPTGYPVAAVCIGGPSFRISPSELVERFAVPVRGAADRIAGLLFGAPDRAAGVESGTA
jgi:IclR family transcriptional regulator, acetate operon repressor